MDGVVYPRNNGRIAFVCFLYASVYPLSFPVVCYPKYSAYPTRSVHILVLVIVELVLPVLNTKYRITPHNIGRRFIGSVQRLANRFSILTSSGDSP